MGLIHENTQECKECGGIKFRAEEQYTFHQTVRQRFYPHEKEKPLPHLEKTIVYKCVECGLELDK